MQPEDPVEFLVAPAYVVNGDRVYVKQIVYSRRTPAQFPFPQESAWLIRTPKALRTHNRRLRVPVQLAPLDSDVLGGGVEI